MRRCGGIYTCLVPSRPRFLSEARLERKRRRRALPEAMPPKDSTSSSATWLFLRRQRVVHGNVVALVEGHVALTCRVVKATVCGEGYNRMYGGCGRL